ncbi:MAG: GNAT family N-acetyltransferase [Flavobacteriaceae bacterium]|nr:GNAT family N-acetyltransferase [Flavobacteriaceae bacterium]
MQNRGIFQWNENYPSSEIFKKDIDSNSLYVYMIKSKILGCIMISLNKDDVYNHVKWLTEDEKNLYVHRLAVDPKYQKKGIGRSLMNFAENYARNNGLKSIRLDTFSENERNNRFYKSRKYIQLNDVYFPNQSKFPFHCYEKILF